MTSMERDLSSARLWYRPLGLEPGDLDAFHALLIDDHIKRFLLDGQTLDREAAAAHIDKSRENFATRGAGLWLVFEAAAGGSSHLRAAPIGFCGFLVFPELDHAFHLVYAFREEHTGKGYASEAAAALVAYGLGQAGLPFVETAVDGPNRASIRVLEKLGFRRIGTMPGAFGDMVVFRYP